MLLLGGEGGEGRRQGKEGKRGRREGGQEVEGGREGDDWVITLFILIGHTP